MRVLLGLAMLSAALAFSLGGGAPFGRVLMALNLPDVAVHFMRAPEWRGVALFRAGDYDAAAMEFSQAGAFFNLGNTQAHRGNYAAALEAFDQAQVRGHPDAQANFDLISVYYAGLGIDAEALALFPKRKEGPTEESFVARGNARAAGTGSDVTNANTMLGLAQLDSRGRLGVRRIFDDRFMLADDRWLKQLADVPGAFLAARIAQEHKRRKKLGLSPPPLEGSQ